MQRPSTSRSLANEDDLSSQSFTNSFTADLAASSFTLLPRRSSFQRQLNTLPRSGLSSGTLSVFTSDLGTISDLGEQTALTRACSLDSPFKPGGYTFGKPWRPSFDRMKEADSDSSMSEDFDRAEVVSQPNLVRLPLKMRLS